MELLKSGLRKVVEASDETPDDEEESFLSFYRRWKTNKWEIDDPTYTVIPKLYQVVTETEGTLQSKFREDVRGKSLQRHSFQLLPHSDLRVLWELLESQCSPGQMDEQTITYSEFKRVVEQVMKSQVGDKIKNYLSAVVFGKLSRPAGSGARASIVSLFNYAMGKVWLQETRISLSLYDSTGQGYLREAELESYLADLVPTLPQLDVLEQSFHTFYVSTAVRKFLFFLDPLRTGKIRIRDALSCGFLDDLLELREESLPKDLQEANWFSAPSALRVYGQYLNLDKDHNGMLSKQELAGFGTGTLTQVFLDRIFQECQTYEGEVDYKTYLDFVLALENRQEPQSLQYFFRLLDIDSKGYLDAFALNYFFRGIQKQMIENGQEPVSFNDVKDEIFDMVKPKDPTRITMQDILKSGQSETVISILIDLNGFWNHENRETIVADDPSDHLKL